MVIINPPLICLKDNVEYPLWRIRYLRQRVPVGGINGCNNVSAVGIPAPVEIADPAPVRAYVKDLDILTGEEVNGRATCVNGEEEEPVDQVRIGSREDHA